MVQVNSGMNMSLLLLKMGFMGYGNEPPGPSHERHDFLTLTQFAGVMETPFWSVIMVHFGSSCGLSDQKTIRVLIVDDHRITREGLRRIFFSDRSLEVVGEASDGREAVIMTERLAPDVITMDVRMPVMDGVAATRQIKNRYPDAAVMMLSLFDDEKVREAFDAGASGYVLKDSDSEHIISAVHQAHRGEFPLSPVLVNRIFSELPGLLKGQQASTLSKRQLQILRLIAEGHSSSIIAGRIYSSQSTIKREIRQILRILGAFDRAQAVSKAIQMKLI
jgi:DNA-binding NarL/FixJ family response regulator